MVVRLNPYLGFRDNAREALEFYQHVFGGELALTTFGQFGRTGPDADLIMHGVLETEHGLTLMAADTPAEMALDPGSTISISLSGDEAGDLRRFWERLAEGGTVSVPLERQMWGDDFGECTDRFGVRWVVNIAGTPG